MIWMLLLETMNITDIMDMGITSIDIIINMDTMGNIIKRNITSMGTRNMRRSITKKKKLKRRMMSKKLN